MKSRPATPPQLRALNALGCLKLTGYGETPPLDYAVAWDALQGAQALGLWKPTRERQEASEKPAPDECVNATAQDGS